MKHRLLAIPIVFMFLVAGFVVFSDEAQAATYWYGTSTPSAYNSTYWKSFPRYSTTPVTLYAAQVYNDDYVADLSTTATYSYIQSNDFTNPLWYQSTGSNYSIYGTPAEMLPPNNGTATIQRVYIGMVFSGYAPGGWLSFSSDNKVTWHTSSVYYASSSGYIFWNVTSEIAWTPAIIHSNELWVQLKTWGTSIHFYLDYVGLSVTWTTAYAIEDLTPTEEPGEGSGDSYDADYDSWIQAGNIVGIMGFVGFIFMIAVPAFGVYVYRNTDEGKMNIFIKMLVLFMVSLSMFMIAVSS